MRGQLALLDRVITAVGQADGFAHGIEEILEITMDALEFEAGAVVLIDEDGETARLVFERGLPDEIRRRFAKVPRRPSLHTTP